MPTRGDITRPSASVPTPLGSAAVPTLGGQIQTGHVGIDVVAPLFQNGSLALYGTGAEALSGALLGGQHPLVVTTDGDPGELAARFRSVLDEISQAPRALIWLRNPATLVDAWHAVDGAGKPRDVAISMFRQALRQMSALATVVASIRDDPSDIALPEDLWTSTGHVDGQLEPLRCHTRAPISPQHAQLIESVRRTLIASKDAEDHASIFGLDELDDDLASAVSRATALRTLLQSGRHDDLETLHQIVEDVSRA
jgi:hypothetical protein